jgi:hypothetical protein
MSPKFADFKVQSAADILLEHFLQHDEEHFDAEYINLENRSAETRNYIWNEEMRVFTTASASRPDVEHKVYVDSVYCSCFAYKKAAYPDKSCVHLRDVARAFKKANWLRSPLYFVVSTRERVAFRELSNDKIKISQQWINANENKWLLSRKYDGVRFLWKKSGEIITRNGLRLLHVELALRDAGKKTPQMHLEGELVTSGEASTAADVQRNIIHAMRRLKYANDFEMYVFDVFSGEGTFETRAKLAAQCAAECGVRAVEQQPLPDKVGVLQKMLLHEIDAKREGLVLQHKDEMYFKGKRSSKKCSLKLKKNTIFAE